MTRGRKAPMSGGQRAPQLPGGTSFVDAFGRRVPGERGAGGGSMSNFRNVQEPIQRDPDLQNSGDRQRAYDEAQAAQGQYGLEAPQNPSASGISAFKNKPTFTPNTTGLNTNPRLGAPANPTAPAITRENPDSLTGAGGDRGTDAANLRNNMALFGPHDVAQPSPVDNSPGAGNAAPFRGSTAKEIADFKNGPGLPPENPATTAAIASNAGKNVNTATPYGTVSSRNDTTGSQTDFAGNQANGPQHVVNSGAAPISAGAVQGPNIAGAAGAPDWEQQVVNKHPEIGKPGTPENKAFVSAFQAMKGVSGAVSNPMALADAAVAKANPAATAASPTASSAPVPPNTTPLATPASPSSQDEYDMHGNKIAPQATGQSLLSTLKGNANYTTPDAAPEDTSPTAVAPTPAIRPGYNAPAIPNPVVNGSALSPGKLINPDGAVATTPSPTASTANITMPIPTEANTFSSPDSKNPMSSFSASPSTVSPDDDDPYKKLRQLSGGDAAGQSLQSPDNVAQAYS